jgi:hypothetical protein
MIIAKYFPLFISLFLVSCNGQPTSKQQNPVYAKVSIIDSTGQTLEMRINVPEGYARISIDPNSFAAYLRSFPLKPATEILKLYNGAIKSNQDLHAAILDIDTGDRDLQQCADAIMRLKCEYHYERREFDDIEFNFTNGMPFPYSKWRNGQRVRISGNDTRWESGTPDESYNAFRKYLIMLFMYAGTWSLEKELKNKTWDNLNIGDVIIHGGSPGHAVIVMDVALDYQTGEKIFLLAQSYMPAQDIHIVRNLNNEDLSPWYMIPEEGKDIHTASWTFSYDELRGFE